MRRQPPDRSAERGAALLTVMLLVAVIAVLAATALERLRLSTRLTGNAAAVEQGRAYAQAAEVLALTRIDGVLGQGLQRVTLAGGWSDRPFGLPVPGGAAVARLTDGGNCFNLNGLVSQRGPGVYVANPAARAQFVRLMRLLNVPAQVAEQVAGGAGDWIDTDDTEQPSGAEDNRYLGGAMPYRTSGTLMADPSELRAVSGVTPDVYRTIRPWLCTLPKAEPAVLNINTLTPEQAPLVAMLFPDTVSVPAARQMLLRRPPQGYGDATPFFSSGGSAATPESPQQAGVTTVWFRLRIDVQLGAGSVEEHGLIDATRLPARLVSRQWGEPT